MREKAKRDRSQNHQVVYSTEKEQQKEYFQRVLLRVLNGNTLSGASVEGAHNHTQAHTHD